MRKCAISGARPLNVSKILTVILECLEMSNVRSSAMRVHAGLDKVDTCLPIPLARLRQFFGLGRDGYWVN
jgi:hypothetical protein